MSFDPINLKLKKESIAALERAHKTYEKRAGEVGKASVQLMELRHSTSVDLVPEVEAYINTLANTPKEFDRSFAEYKSSFSSFNKIIQTLQSDSVNADIKTGVSAGASIAAGAGVVAFAPTAAMGIATTFGVASTGTAISALSGAAATNAALAWLGGGALAAGGGGMAAGNALLALAGPIGWGIGGILLAGTGVFTAGKNKKIAQEANEKRKEIRTYIASLDAASVEIEELIKLTTTHANGIRSFMQTLQDSGISDYNEFSVQHKEMAGALVNHIFSLSALLNKKINA